MGGRRRCMRRRSRSVGGCGCCAGGSARSGRAATALADCVLDGLVETAVCYRVKAEDINGQLLRKHAIATHRRPGRRPRA